MDNKHVARKGVGCRHEECVDDTETIICGYAETRFGKYYECTAPKECFMDIKIKKSFDSDKHCPNCSKINKPFNLIKDDDNHSHCKKCGFGSIHTKGVC